MKNTWFNRYYESSLHKLTEKGKVFVLYGPRRVGKTELIKKFLNGSGNRIFQGTGDDMMIREILSSQQKTRILSSFDHYDTIFIDEAQRIPEVGWGLKILVDHLPETKIIVTGSSSFSLSGKIGEPLTGRNRIATLFPLSVLELHNQFGGMEIQQKLEELLIYGAYPEILKITSKEKKIEYLFSLRDSYLLKDILELENIKYSGKLTDLLKLLAFQIGNQVSLNELANHLQIAKQSVEKYLDLLEKAFVIKKMSGYSKNLRKEVTKTARYYFWDNGIRNAIINNFNLIDNRNDIGMLWENFLFIERLKKQAYTPIYSNNYFWRTYDKKEIDFVEERDGKLYGYEFKWKPQKRKAPLLWKTSYPDSTFEIIDQDNFLKFLK